MLVSLEQHGDSIQSSINLIGLNTFPNNARMKFHGIDLDLGKVVSISIIYLISDSELSFIEWLRFLYFH